MPENRVASVSERLHRFTVVVVGGIVAVPVKQAEQLFLFSVGMTVRGDRRRLFLQRLEDRRGMAHGGNDRPDRKRQAKKRRKRTPSESL